jgi:Cysteine rich repeat
MQRLVITSIIGFVLCGLGSLAWAQKNPGSLRQAVAEACENDLKTYCSQVTPGEKRLLACVYAHEDKLSDQCTYALYQASVILEQAAQAVAYVGKSCRNDIEAHCQNVEIGKGRMLTCLKDHSNEVSNTCKTAIKEVSK